MYIIVSMEEQQNNRSGYVYCMTNKLMPGICKIGMTTRTPEQRATELFQTGVPCPFEVALSKPCIDAFAEEQLLFRVFKERNIERCNELREFFVCTPEQVKDLFEYKQDQDKCYDQVQTCTVCKKQVKYLDQHMIRLHSKSY